MNALLTGLIEQTFEMVGYAGQVRGTPNPFRPINGKEPWWLAAAPEDFYAIPQKPPKLTFHKVWSGLQRTRARFTFPSYDISPYPKNNRVHGLANLCPDCASRAALVVIYGHRMNSFAMLEWFAIPAARLGLDVYFLALPYHMQRAPEGTWSGQYSLNSSVEGTALAFRQGVQDVRALISWIEQEKGTPVALAGMSLGAFTSCMTAVVDDRPKALISILGGGSLAQIHWDGYQMGRPRRQLLNGGVGRARLEKYWALLGPAHWQPKLAKENILMLAGKYDPIVTPGNVDRLWRAWNQPSIRWYPCGHGTIVFYYREVVREIVRFLKKNLLGQNL